MLLAKGEQQSPLPSDMSESLPRKVIRGVKREYEPSIKNTDELEETRRLILASRHNMPARRSKLATRLMVSRCLSTSVTSFRFNYFIYTELYGHINGTAAAITVTLFGF